MSNVRALLQVVARAYVTMVARGETCNMYLSDFARNISWIKGLSIVGPDARIKCSTVAEGAGLDVSDRDYYRNAVENNDFVVSNYLIGRMFKRPVLMTAYPVAAIDPTANAVVLGSIDIRWINNLVNSLNRRPGSTVLLTDGAGTLIAGDAEVAERIGSFVGDSALVQAMETRDEGTLRSTGLDGIPRVFGFLRTPGSEARLAVGFDEAEILKRGNRDIVIAYIQLAIFGAMVLLAAWFGGERLIVEPIRSLARTASRIGRGDPDVRVARERWAPEFAPLAAALNDTARKLAERERELLAANQHLEQLASLDPLSGLANRRGFDARLAAEWQRAGKFGRPVALLMVDVDHFKLFNDRYGHVEGDVCLRRLGKLLREAARSDDDLPARYGGEEFVLLLPGADSAAALAVGRALRSAVEDLCIAHASSQCGQVTISVGIASLIPGLGEKPERLIEAADAALYGAKHQGRNTVFAHCALRLHAAA